MTIKNSSPLDDNHKKNNNRQISKIDHSEKRFNQVYDIPIAILIILIPIEAILAAFVLFFIPGEYHSSSALGLSANRIIMISVLLLIALVFGGFLWIGYKKPLGRYNIAHWYKFLKENNPCNQMVLWISSICLISIATSFWSVWIFFPQFHVLLIRLAPLLTFLFLAVLQVMIIALYLQPNNGIRKWVVNILVIILGLFVLVLFVNISFDFSNQVNHAPTQGASDQLAYMNILINMQDSQYPFIGDGNRMPLFLWIQTIFYRADDSYDAAFHLAKTVNILLSAILLVFLFIIFYFSWHSIFYAFVVTMMAAFSIFIFKAAYFTCENLFYFLSFVSFICMVKMFRRPSSPLAILTGILTGLTFLTKASVLPALMIFIATGTAGILWEVYQSKEKNQHVKTSQITQWVFWGVLVVVVFFVIILPFGIQNRIVFGGFFRNVNTNIVMWMDSWKDYKELVIQYSNLRQLLDDAPVGPASYLKTHTFGQIADRLLNGIGWQMHLVSKPYNQFSYPLLLLFILFLGGIWGIKDYRHFIAKRKGEVLFSVCYFVGYFLLFSWYTAIDKGPRFVMGLYLPFYYAVFSVLTKQKWALKPVYHSFRALDFISLGLMVLVLVDSYQLLSFQFLLREYGY